MTNPIYSFLKACGGNWRNAIFLDCRQCVFGRSDCCPGFLLAIDADGKAVIIAVETLQKSMSETIDKVDCAAIVDIHAFERACSSWLIWQTDDSTCCPFLQLTTF